VIRQGPTFTAPDGGDNTFFGSDDGDAGAFPNFYGTSAATPHAGGVVALMLQANGALTAPVIADILKASAIDMDNPATAGFDTGFDVGTGAGLIQADKAVALALARKQTDFDGDGKGDILWRDTAGHTSLWLMDGGQIKRAFDFGTIGPVWRSSTGDFDGDGKSDILWRTDAGQTTIWEMDGGQIKQAFDLGALSPGAGWNVERLADFDGDGRSGDILWRDGTGHTSLWLMDGGQIKPGGASDLGVVGASWNPFAGDFNGDGKGDILWRDNEGHTALWEMDGGRIKPNAAFDLRAISPGSAWTVERLGDFDGDGKSGDILWRDTTGHTSMWLMDGRQIKPGGAFDLGTIGASWKAATGTGDLDGDGRTDILWRDNAGHTVLWEMNGGQIKPGGAIDLGATSPGAGWNVANDHWPP